MIQNLTRTDLMRLIRGCEPGMEHVGMLQQHGLGEYVGGMNDHWEWTDKESAHWNDVSEEELWQLYLTITNDDRDEYAPPQVYVVTDGYEDAEVKAVFTDEATAERYKDAEGRSGWVIEPYDLNPHFEEHEKVWKASLQVTTLDMSLEPDQSLGYGNHLAGYIRRYGDYLCTWLRATDRYDASAKANEVFLSVTRGREQGKFRYLNQEIYLPVRQYPDIKKYPFYDVASGKIVMGDISAVLIPKSEALLPDGTPNPDLFILLDRHFVERKNLAL